MRKKTMEKEGGGEREKKRAREKERERGREKREKERERRRKTKMRTTGTKINHDENKILFYGIWHNNVHYHQVSFWISNSIGQHRNLFSSVQHCL